MLRHARPRALRRRADARLHPRREGPRRCRSRIGNALAPQDVIKTVRRRHPAPVGRSVRLFRRPAHRAGNPQDHRRGLPQAAQHAALDARHARALRRRPSASSRQDMPRARALMLHRLAVLDGEVRDGLCRLRLQATSSPLLVAVHEHRSFGLLFRHPQGRALLRSAIEPRSAARRCTVIDEIFNALVAWLAPILSFTAEEAWLARYPGDEGSVHLADVPRDPGRLAQRRAGAEVGAGARRAPRRHRRAGDRAARPSASARRLEAAPDVYVADGDLLRALEGVDLAEVCDHQRRGSSPSRRRRTPSRCRTCRASASCRSSRRAGNARAPGASCPMSAPTPNFPICRRAMPPPCASSTPAPRPVRNEQADRRAHAGSGAPTPGWACVVALTTLVLDQAHKWWMLHVFGIADLGRVERDAVPRSCLREEHRHQLLPV